MMGEDYERSVRRWAKAARKNALILPQDIDPESHENKLISSYILNVQKLRGIGFASSVSTRKNQ